MPTLDSSPTEWVPIEIHLSSPEILQTLTLEKLYPLKQGKIGSLLEQVGFFKTTEMLIRYLISNKQALDEQASNLYQQLEQSTLNHRSRLPEIGNNLKHFLVPSRKVGFKENKLSFPYKTALVPEKSKTDQELCGVLHYLLTHGYHHVILMPNSDTSPQLHTRIQMFERLLADVLPQQLQHRVSIKPAMADTEQLAALAERFGHTENDNTIHCTYEASELLETLKLHLNNPLAKSALWVNNILSILKAPWQLPVLPPDLTRTHFLIPSQPDEGKMSELKQLLECLERPYTVLEKPYTNKEIE